MMSADEQEPRKFSPEEIARHMARVNSPAFQRRTIARRLVFAIEHPPREYRFREAKQQLWFDAMQETDRRERRMLLRLHDAISREPPPPRPAAPHRRQRSLTARSHRPRSRRARLARMASSGGDSGDDGDPEPDGPCPENASGPLTKRADSRAAERRADATVAPSSTAGQAVSADDAQRFARIVARLRQRFDCAVGDAELFALAMLWGLDWLEIQAEFADETFGARRYWA